MEVMVVKKSYPNAVRDVYRSFVLRHCGVGSGKVSATSVSRCKVLVRLVLFHVAVLSSNYTLYGNTKTGRLDLRLKGSLREERHALTYKHTEQVD